MAARAIAAKGTHEAVIELLRQEPGVRRVLDIPCGEGALAERLLQLGCEVVLADVVDRVQLNGTRFVRADMNERLPLGTGELDAVVCVDGIEHIERPYDFVKECARVLRDSGVLILSTPNVSSLRSRWRWLWTGFHNGRKTPLDETNPNPLHHINMLELPKLRYMLHRDGFRIAKIATNRCKAVAYAFAPLVPLSWLMTRLVFAVEIKRPAVKAISGEVMDQIFSRPVLFGDALVVKATRLPRRRDG